MFKIVIIENERLVRNGLILTIDWAGIDTMIVGEASNGLEGISIITETNPDIVITDIRMPELDGLKMIEKLQQENIATEYIIVSGFNEFEYAQKAIRLGVVDFLLKPINEDELKDCIKRILKRISINKSQDKLLKKISNIENSPYMLFEKYFQEHHVNSKEKIISNTIQYITNHLNHDLTISTISERLQVSTGHLSRSFKKVTGYTVLEYITFIRMRKAIELLEDSQFRIAEIAYAVGFNDPKYFSNIFHKYVGVTPTEFRDRLN